MARWCLKWETIQKSKHKHNFCLCFSVFITPTKLIEHASIYTEKGRKQTEKQEDEIKPEAEPLT